jgi:DNA-binding NtrC family response regulator
MSARTVMIVDDEADCAATLEVALEALPSIEVVQVLTAEAAMDSLRRRGVAVIISDIQLPGKSGLELIASAGKVPVVIVSASVDAGVKDMALRMGAAAFFAKPFSPAAVREKVRELLEDV